MLETYRLRVVTCLAGLLFAIHFAISGSLKVQSFHSTPDCVMLDGSFSRTLSDLKAVPGGLLPVRTIEETTRYHS